MAMNRMGALIGGCAALFAACCAASATMAGESGARASDSVAADSNEKTEAGLDAGLPNTAFDKTCIRLQSIDRTDVIDDYNILFYMRGPDIYHVRLPYRCPGLRIADSFMYSTSLNVLCDLDIIRPLRNFGGGLRPGAGCGMGRFTPIMKEEIALLKNKDIEIEAGRGEADIETLVDAEGVEERE